MEHLPMIWIISDVKKSFCALADPLAGKVVPWKYANIGGR
tara:strand:+ start:346 stop:465 length:120 start_codon:yes stop_codon:yes gene_type:complete